MTECTTHSALPKDRLIDMTHIIVVDDALTDRTLITGLLNSEFTCDVQTAENGEAALGYIDARRPDIVLTDLKMPGMGGLELLRSIKEDHPMIPVVVMTGYDSEQIVTDVMKAGAADYVTKRRLAEDLPRTVERIIFAKQNSMVSPELVHGIATETGSRLFSKSIYDHPIVDIDGNQTSLKKYKGKVLLIVNVASRCGFTCQYRGLEKIHQKYRGRGLVVCGFPCNQFGGQEPGTEQEIKEFCSVKYGVTFPVFSKIFVNGPDRHSVYETLVGKDSPVRGSVNWNFTKILVGRNGIPLARFGPWTFPAFGKLRRAIEQALEGSE